MCSTEPMGPTSILVSKKLSNKKVSLKMVEKRLKHLREELKNLTQRNITSVTSNLLNELQPSNNDEHHVQYKKRVDHLLRLHDKQVNNLNLWRFFRSHTIEHMYGYELRQSDETFQTKRNDFKSKLLSTYNDKRRYLDFEHQNVNIRCRQFPNHEQFMLTNTNNNNDIIQFDGHNHHPNESAQQQQQQQRPTYNLRRTVVNDLISENAPTTSLKDLSIFSRSNSVLPPFGGIELQRCLSNNDIEKDIKDIQDGVSHNEITIEKDSSKTKIDDLQSKSVIDVRIEEGRLWYQRAWFSRNSPILLVFDDLEIVPALVLTVGRNDLLIRRSGTNIKHRVSLSLLYDGHLAIRKRNCIF
ncbi:unnamed protein product [Rotaria magnacalcarata]|uniref:Uncharacterized protein n=3 Tax=Rotaria magnacalcarata TaxID=392030 RepID=A0A816M9S9_9BILA|nr:unnamed protein product [Rotaria magnacalcarata]CAF1425151.1 unnamed protein product [Rotaria magnacalcarata]CAF1985019.1 unnamed protein product [Rotaria magnacalcarata]CAF2087261.1 unnamed protein product [Rotaria magnacalcarata]CAF2111291.1 unnamed protein product [Rotaria magnacalcarata]